MTDDLYDHPHGDSCCAPECCVHDPFGTLPDSADMAPPGSCGNRNAGRLPPLTRRGGGEHDDATRP